MNIINQAAPRVHPMAFLTTLAILTGTTVLAATHEPHQQAALIGAVSTSASTGDMPSQRIIDIQDPGDGTLGTILFGDSTSAKPTSSRRGPR
ncbi:hypothetical protein [Alsobacter sp. R-9]